MSILDRIQEEIVLDETLDRINRVEQIAQQRPQPQSIPFFKASGVRTVNGVKPNGQGDVTVSTSGGTGIVRVITTVTTTTVALAASNTDYIYLCNGTFTITLPTAVGNTNRYGIKNIGSGTVTIATTSAQTIDGSSTAVLAVSNTSLDLISDNSNWKVI